MKAAKSNLALRQNQALQPALSPRVDLRSGLAVAMRVEAPAKADSWIEALAATRETRAAMGARQPLIARAPHYLFDAGAAGQLDALLRGAGFQMRAVTVEIDEADLVSGGVAAMAAVERLRARGWGVSLSCAPDCPLAIGQRTRSLFTEMAAPAPTALTPAMVMADPMHSPLTRRLRAAQNAGIPTTALGVKSPAHAGLLIALGFDRGEGPGYRA